MLPPASFLTMQIAPSRSTSRSLAFAATSGIRTRFLVLAALVASFDLLTKAVATNLLSGGDMVSLSDRVAFMLVYNTGGAGGVMFGPNTWALNVIVTSVAIALVTYIVTPLAVVDRRAVLSLGMVAGGAFGNLTSMVTGSKGVADFLAIDLSSSTTIVINGADVMLWGGALLLVPVVVRLVSTVRAERAAR